MKHYSSTVSLLLMGFILVLGFQNCSSSKFSTDDLVEDAPLSSIQIEDGQYTEGLSFDYIAKTINETASELKINKTSASVYSAQAGNSLSTCTVEIPNAMEDLMQITEVAKITHPAFLSSPEVCDPSDGKFIHYKIGDHSPIYLIASSQEDNCLTDDPQDLLDENKRVFVIDNLSFEEIESLIEDSKTIIESSSCVTNNLTIE